MSRYVVIDFHNSIRNVSLPFHYIFNAYLDVSFILQQVLAWAKVYHLCITEKQKSILTGFLSRCLQYWLMSHWPRHLFKHQVNNE